MEKSLHELPKDWVWVALGDVIEQLNPGFPCGKHNQEKRGVPHLRPMNITSKGEIDLTIVKYVEVEDYTPLHKGDILFNNTNSPVLLGKTSYIKQDTNWAYSNHMTRISISKEFLSPAWIAYSLHNLFITGYFQLHCTNHVNQASINSSFLLQRVKVPLPPLNEQRRIVAKIEVLKARSQRVKEALEAIPPLLDQFRQSVLAAAFRGDLTADWREQNPDVEPASVLLERIRAERRYRWEEAELEKMKASGKIPKNDKWEKKYEEPPTPNLSLLPQLVDGWTYSFLEPLLSTKRTGLKTGPFGSLLKKHEHRADGIPVLGIENISSMGFVKGNKIYIDEAKAKDLVDYDAQAGDVLISRSGTVGEVCVVPSGIGEARISTNLIRICLAENALLPEYFCFLFRGSSFILNQISDLCSGSTRDFLNQTILSSLIFPIPPWEEQQEIVQRIKALFDFSNKIENQVLELAQSLEWLNQSILAKAFRGELVPQDPNDEPASVLLERIRAERAKQDAAKTAKKSTPKITGQRRKKAQQQNSEPVQLELPGLE